MVAASVSSQFVAWIALLRCAGVLLAVARQGLRLKRTAVTKWGWTETLAAPEPFIMMAFAYVLITRSRLHAGEPIWHAAVAIVGGGCRAYGLHQTPIEAPSSMVGWCGVDDATEWSDWRGQMLSRLRALVKEADPEVVEEWKWRGVPVWSHDGLICTGETYKNVVKMTFAKGAALKDPSGLFNSSLDGNTRRAIDFHEGEKIDEEALKTLVRAAVTLNESTARS